MNHVVCEGATPSFALRRFVEPDIKTLLVILFLACK